MPNKSEINRELVKVFNSVLLFVIIIGLFGLG